MNIIIWSGVPQEEVRLGWIGLSFSEQGWIPSYKFFLRFLLPEPLIVLCLLHNPSASSSCETWIFFGGWQEGGGGLLLVTNLLICCVLPCLSHIPLLSFLSYPATVVNAPW